MTWTKQRIERLLADLSNERIRDFAQGRDAEYIDAVIAAEGNYTRAAEACGVSNQAVNSAISKLRLRAAAQGFAPSHDMLNPVPLPHMAKGVSTLYGGDGNVKLQWVKSAQGPNNPEIARQELELWASTLPENRLVTSVPRCDLKNSVTVYPIGDHHLGMFAWSGETAEDHDLRRGCDLLLSTSACLMQRSPNTEVAVVASVGDFYHADNKSNRTEASGHALDVDTRWAKVLHAGFALMRQIIEMALAKHQRVYIVNVPGNHDDLSATMLTFFLSAWYRNEPRVVIDTSRASAARHYLQFGRVLLCFDHGHQMKPEKLASIIPTERKDVWSHVRSCYAYRGHFHHDWIKDFPGVRVEHLRVLPPGDAWHTAHGYIGAGRDFKAIVHDFDRGEVERLTEPVDLSRFAA